ncbi:Clavaminate synthase-like protein [Guyanagaster necrorhizus]|uniref:Clavaminate synthase-like protein n=1 Tax=Guyanagaster necrorhizus TaxID=856835 RepID=A0A9P7VZ14_9AGAR|nr:Clavaminate synthase-like protein [Guyanagaster necrorhizus MCA 3950]KAG7449183.1 Clavaminate synthase-like protein [Guyanagaster necrorhizus MCA 3950]
MECLKWFSREYHDLNGSHIQVLDRPPTPLEFSRIAHISRPVVIHGLHIPATKDRWSNEYLCDKMKDRPISVSVTPNGLADAVTTAPDGISYFVEPHVELMTMGDLLSKFDGDTTRAYYLQSQNGNVYSAAYFDNVDSDFSEFDVLRPDIPSEIHWCSKSFDKHPDAVNLWIGDSKSITSIHCDPYENIYTVVRGVKYFTLLPPSEGWCLQERTYPHAQYIRASPSTELCIKPSPPSTPTIRWSSVGDPNLPGALPDEANPINVVLQAGETLYLPAGWWHHVRQSDEITVALNWWYDIEMRGMTWVLLTFLRGTDSPMIKGKEDDMEGSEVEEA